MKHKVAGAIFIVCFLLTFILSSSIGASWDEPDNIWASGVYIHFVSSGFKPSVLLDKNASNSYFHDRIFTQEPSLYRYPPFPLYIGSIITLVHEKIAGTLTPPQIINDFHIASGLFWSLLAVSVFYFVDLFGFPLAVSFLTAFLVAFHPTLFGYGLSDIKDSSQVSLFVASLLLLVKSSYSGKKRYLLFGSLVWGFAIDSKINAVYVPVIWGLWRFIVLTVESFHRRHIDTKKYISFAKECAVIASIGLVTMIVLWPYLWFDPINRIGEVIRYFTTVGTGYKVFWNGTIYMVGYGSALPWYPILHIIVGTPIIVLLFSTFGFFTALHSIYRKDKKKYMWLLLLILWMVIPLARILSSQSAFYDGMRHFLEVLPPFILLSAWGIHGISTIIAKRFHYHQAIALMTVGCITYTVFLLWHFFPYSSGYVNAFIHNPNTTVERDFAGLSVAEAVKAAHILRPKPSRFYVPIGGHLSWYYLTYGDQYVYTGLDADIIILINKSSHVNKTEFDTQISSLFDLKKTIYRGNDVFAWIYVKRNDQ